ncbi:MAG: hypothetical protein PQJ61_14635 [Spirochaetales bacterium]|uniref:Adenylylsulfate kinase n=1 Tax=Candidatus Thalassospirochaeta sargassi TaxID=3119039 RepID=A0AAJ1IHE5_9SPIO|nr:hypothetical protein [Spirochaetales bacterium]
MFDYSKLITGDMPGDKIQIGDSHIKRSDTVFPILLKKVKASGKTKIVISVYGGSGVGKSEIGSLLATRFRSNGYGAYVLSGDNYPYRIPAENDRERENRFRYGGLSAIAESDGFCSDWMDIVHDAWLSGADADPELAEKYEFMRDYQEAGKTALSAFLCTPEEIDFGLVNRIIKKFKHGEKQISLKRMGRAPEELYFESVDFSSTKILIIEWTHGNNSALEGVDFPVFLYSTPEQTLEHRISRARDKGVDSPFTSIVLEIEQQKLNEQAQTASITIGKDGELIV